MIPVSANEDNQGNQSNASNETFAEVWRAALTRHRRVERWRILKARSGLLAVLAVVSLAGYLVAQPMLRSGPGHPVDAAQPVTYSQAQARTPPAADDQLRALTARTSALPVIFDTDMANSIDDTLALAMLLGYQRRGLVDLLAVTINYDNAQIVPYVDAIDTYYGYPDTPLGIVKQGGVAAGSDAFHPQVGGTFPHTFTSSSQADSAVTQLRRRLAAEPDHSVVIIEAGFATNLAQLLDSPPDGISPLNGATLVKTKVKLLAATTGDFLRAKPDFNSAKDPTSARRVFGTWPTPVVASEWQIGADLPFPGQAVADMADMAEPAGNPVLAAMTLNGQNSLLVSFPYNPPSFDLTTVLYAVEPESYFSVGEPGKISLDDQLIARFTPSPEGQHRLLQQPLDPRTRARITDRFVELVNSRTG